MKTINFDEYISQYGDPTIAMAAVIKELQSGGILQLENRVYEFHADRAMEKYGYVSNNDNGMKRVLMPLENRNDITIEGNGAQFLLHGHLMAALLEGCSNITFRNLSIDYSRPFHSEVEILEVTGNQVTLRIDPEKYPFHLMNDCLFFDGEGWSSNQIQSLLMYDPKTADLVPGAGDWYIFQSRFRAASPESDTIVLEWGNYPSPYQLIPGMQVILAMVGRDTPAFAVSGCNNIRYENVTIYHSYAMGFLFQDCRNVTLSSCRVIPPRGRLISACADASHFVNCSGEVLVENCVFEAQMDDAVNVHGIYTVVDEIGENQLLLRYMHYQQAGTPIYHVGDTLRFVKCRTMTPFGMAQITECIPLNSSMVILKTTDLPDGLEVGDAAENLTRIPDNVVIKGCKTGKNRARSFLLSAGRKITVCGNELHSSGSAIYISGDANYWYESGNVGTVEICNNEIYGCNKTAGWGNAAIDIVPEIPDLTESYFHESISIHDNQFLLYRDAVLFARAVRHLKIYHNSAVYLPNSVSESEYAAYSVTACGFPALEPMKIQKKK